MRERLKTMNIRLPAEIFTLYTARSREGRFPVQMSAARPPNIGSDTGDNVAVVLAQLNELRAELEQIRGSRKQSTQFPILTFLMVVVLVGLFLYFIQDQSNRFTAMGNGLREQLVTEARNAQISAVPTEIAQRIAQKLDYLELRQTAVLEESRSSIQRQSFVFTTVAAFFGLFTLFFGYRQLFVESRGSEARDKHDQEMRGLVRSFQNNITTISSLISTLEQSFAYRSKIEDQLKEIQAKAQSLEHHQEETDIAFEGMLDALNRDALTVVPLGIDRAALSFEENRRRMEAFAARMIVAERTRNVEQRLNPFCYHVRGLSNVTTYQYELAIADLDVAARRAREDLAKPSFDIYALDQRENLKTHLQTLLVSCSYFQGICYKNLGHYSESQAKFREALEQNRYHYESRSYLLQVMFFDERVPFQQVETEYQKANEEVASRLATASQEEREKLKRSGYQLKIDQGNIYYPKPRLLADLRTSYRKYEDAERAAKCYWEAYDFVPNYLATFTLAQGLELVGSSIWRTTTPKDLYASAYTGLKSQVAGDYDRLYSVTLYYMLAICARKLGDSAAASEVFLSQARHSLKEVPTHVTCFSQLFRPLFFTGQML